MSGESDTSWSRRAVLRFSDGLLATDLPGLGADRRRAACEFVARRVDGLPSMMRFGVRTIGVGVDGIGSLIGHDRVRSLVLRLPLPFVSEYPRLVRSLGYAHVCETWPDTTVDGSAPVARA